MSGPWRRDFDAARDPYAARNALGITGTGGGGGAPTNAEYVTSSADATLTNERVLTDTASITWDFSTPGQAKASTTAGGGNVSNSGTPTSGQYAKWVTSTTIQGVSTATVLSDIGAAPVASPTFTGDPKAPTPATADNDTSIATTAYVQAQGYLTSAAAAGAYQPLDADLTALAGISGVQGDVIYRDASSWTRLGAGTSGQFLQTQGASANPQWATPGGGGNVSNSGTPAATQYARWVTSTTIEGRTTSQVLSDVGAAASTDFPSTAWSTYTPTVSGTGLTSSTINTARYTKAGKTITVYFDISIVASGGSGFLSVTLPVTVGSSAAGMSYGREITATGHSLVGQVLTSPSSRTALAKYDGSTLIVNGYRVTAVCVYESA